MKDLYGYIRVNKSTNTEQLLELFNSYNCKEVIIDDSASPKSDNSPFSQLKNKVSTISASILIDSIDSLGKTSREISKELTWLEENQIELYVISIPSTFTNNSLSIRILCELYCYKAAKERKNVSDAQYKGQRTAQENNIRSGRPLTPYPKDWEKNYNLWQNGAISTAEFMNYSKVKKGTFYNLIKRYKAEIAEVNSTSLSS